MNNNCICKIRKIYRCISEFELQLQKAFGLNFNEAMLLCVLSEKEKMLSGEIADELQLSRSNASKVIASLEKEAYIRRNVCPHDSRCMSFHLTKKGRELIDRIHCSQFSLSEELRQIAESMTEEEITTNNNN